MRAIDSFRLRFGFRLGGFRARGLFRRLAPHILALAPGHLLGGLSLALQFFLSLDKLVVIPFSHVPPVRTGTICINRAKKNPHALFTGSGDNMCQNRFKAQVT
jgi:hypothetical protein